MARIVIDPGHGGSQTIPGDSTSNNAVGPNGTLEKNLTLDLGLRAQKALANAGHDVRLTRATDVNLKLSDRAKVAKDFQGDAFVSIHFNGSANHNAQGTETLVNTNHSQASARLSLAVQDALLRVTGHTDRNKTFNPATRIKPQSLRVLRPELHHPSTAGCLVEVSFLDRGDEEQRLREEGYRQRIAQAIAEGIESFTGRATAPADTRAVGEPIDLLARDSAAADVQLVHQNLDKFEFLRRNDGAIRVILDRVASRLTGEYGSDAVPVSLLDAWVITNCEAGITSTGKIDPTFVHSNGEVGLYPLPSNITFWNGPDAPAFNQPSSLATNVFHYYLYLGQLKNKAVRSQDGLQLYRDLFRQPGATPDSHGKILAGVVHGYFFAGTYSDGQVPLRHLLSGYAAGLSLADMLAATAYKHAGSSIIPNRERNIKIALEAMQAIPS